MGRYRPLQVIRALAAAAAMLAVIPTPAPAVTLYWDADLLATNNNVDTGEGLGNTTTLADGFNHWNPVVFGVSGGIASWWDGVSGTNQIWMQGAEAVFWGTAGTVHRSDGNAIQVSVIEFRTTGYVIDATGGGGQPTNLVGAGEIRPLSDVTATITAPLGGTVGLTKTGLGTLILGGSSKTYTGASIIAAGTLQLGNSNVIPNASNLVVSGGTFNLGAFSESVGDVVLTSGSIIGTGTLTGNSYSVESGLISANLGGAGVNLTKNGPGTVTLSGVNTYGGMTTVNQGVLNVTGTLANNGSDKVHIALDADGDFTNGAPTLIRAITSGGGYAGFGSTSSGDGLDSSAQLMAGTNASGAAQNMAMSWRTREGAEPLTLRSDVLNLTGIDGQAFVLQVSYEPEPGDDEAAMVLAYFDGSNWVNAVLGNSGGDATDAGDTSWAAWYSDQLLEDILGYYGRDTTNNVVWAVLNHNSEFAAAAVVPLPAAVWVGITGLATLGGISVARRRVMGSST